MVHGDQVPRGRRRADMASAHRLGAPYGTGDDPRGQVYGLGARGWASHRPLQATAGTALLALAGGRVRLDPHEIRPGRSQSLAGLLRGDLALLLAVELHATFGQL